MFKVILWLSLGSHRADAGLWQNFCEALVADATPDVVAEEFPLDHYTTEFLIKQYRLEGGHSLWKRETSNHLAHLGYVLRGRSDMPVEAREAIEDYGDWERWPRRKGK